MKILKNKAFTMIEMLLTISVFSIIMVIIVNIYISMVGLKYNIQAKQNLLESSYFVMERLNILLKDYTIDYEEYFNRSAVGCSGGNPFDTFDWNVGRDGYCKDFTAYGNRNSFLANTGMFANYYCSSMTTEPIPYQVYKNVLLDQGSGCYNSLVGYQSYGQYKYQFIDMKDDSDYTKGVVNDDDDENLGIGPRAIFDQDNVKELYLISQNGTKRLLLRRNLVNSGDFNGTGGVGDIENELGYTIQILKLRGFDAGDNHDFDTNSSSGVYDGKIDTWACDYSQGFTCAGSGVGNNIYSGYKLAEDENDGRKNLFDRNLTISDRNISISPTKNPDYSFAENELQINPYFTISFTSRLYAGIWRSRLENQLKDFSLHLKTTFNTRNFYTK